MPRSIDTCTCSCRRSRHIEVKRLENEKHEDGCADCSCPRFIPHPQPNAATVPPRISFANALSTLGEVEVDKDPPQGHHRFRVTNTATKEKWEVVAKKIT